MLNIGDILAGKYRIEDILGEGGLGKVYLGYDDVLQRRVAIKELEGAKAREAPEAFQKYRERFLKEAQLLGHLSHPNIVAVYDLEETPQGDLYLVLEYVSGESLEERLFRGPLDVGQAVQVALDIGCAIAAMASRGIVHRDIKPSNILLTESGRAKLTDFGLAQVAQDLRRTQEAFMHPGTPAYKSPEQASFGGYLDERSDLYSLGVVLYEMLTGRLYARDRVPPHRFNPSIPLALSKVVMKALKEDLAERYPSAQAFCRDLERVQAQSALGQFEILLRGVSKQQWAVSGLAVVLMVFLWGMLRLTVTLHALGAYTLAEGRPTEAAPMEAQAEPSLSAQGERPLALLLQPGEKEVTMVPLVERSAPEVAPPLDGTPALALEEEVPEVISLGERQTRTFGREGEVHRVAFRVKAGRAYLVSTSNLAVGVDTRLEVVVNEQVLVNDDISPGTLASQVSFTALEDGTAMAAVYNQDQFGPGRTYDLTVIMLEATPTPTAVWPSPTSTPIPTLFAGGAAAPTFTPRPTLTSSPTFTLRPTWTPTLTPTWTQTPTPSPTWTRRPTWTLIPTYTRTPTPTSTPTPTVTVTPTPTLEVTPSPTLEPTATPTPVPTNWPTLENTPLPTPSPGLPGE